VRAAPARYVGKTVDWRVQFLAVRKADELRPEIPEELENVTVADGVAGLEAVFVGTHIAEFAGVPATGTAVRLPYSVFYDISGRKINALRAYFPITALARQLSDAAAADA